MADETASEMIVSLDDKDFSLLKRCVEDLEHPSLVARVADFVGTPIDKVFDALPQKASQKIGRVVHGSLEAALRTAVFTMRRKSSNRAHPLLHKFAVGASGAGGGAFGLAAIAIELPITTSIMLRSIADIARAEGEDLGISEGGGQGLAFYGPGDLGQVVIANEAVVGLHVVVNESGNSPQC